MLIVVAVIGLLIAAAAPSLASLFIKNKLETGANEFMAALSFARSEAISRGVNVRVQRVVDASNELVVRNWTPGWEVRIEGSNELLREARGIPESLTLYSAVSTVVDVAFSAQGRRDPFIPGVDRVFVFCHGTDTRFRSRAVIVSDAGGVRLASTSSDGRPLKSSSPDVPITDCFRP